MTEEVRKRADRLLAQGLGGAETARRLGLEAVTVNKCRRGGLIGTGPADAGKEEAPDSAVSGGPEAGEGMIGRGERDGRDREAPMGRGARDCAGRVAASAGGSAGAVPDFPEPLPAVAGGGVLAALPALPREGPLKRPQALLPDPGGYYGTAVIPLFPAFLFPARIRCAGAVRSLAPGEAGAVPGLDRCPEAKTLRRRVRLLAANADAVRSWQDSLASDWLAETPEATLSVDGHVKVHAGRRGRLPKHFVSRRKPCLPAAADYWVNALGGRPLLCMHKDLDPALAGVLGDDIMPALERLGIPGPDAPDPTGEDADPALTLVFDRGGWSPALFRRLAGKGVAVITWHRNFRGEAWPEEGFRPFSVPVTGPAASRGTGARPAGRRIRLRDGPEVRRIRRLPGSGRQIPLVTTDFRMPVEQAAGALFPRWSQENFLKAMRTEFNLDGLPVHGLAEQDPEARVVNPLWRSLDRDIREAARAVAALRARIADLRRGEPSDSALGRAERLRIECEAADAAREGLKRKRRETPTHVAAGEPGEPLDALPSKERTPLDAIRMIAYRAETRMMTAVGAAQGRKQRPRGPLKALFRSDADIIPDPENGTLRVRIPGSSCDAADNAVAGLLRELNETRTVYPGTGLRLVYELPGKPAGTGEAGS